MSAPRSNRPRARRFDDDEWQPDTTLVASRPDELDIESDDVDEPDEPAWSTYRDASKGPQRVPGWVVTDPRAVDEDLGVMKTGKVADV